MAAEVDIVAKVILDFVGFVSAVFKRLRINFDGGRFYVSLVPDKETKGTIDERIAKIDLAKANLIEGLQAIDELKEEAERNKEEIIVAVEQVTRLEKDKTHLQTELDAIKEIVETDVSAFRKVAGVLGPAEIRRERILGFVSGVIASVTATGLVALIVWLVKHFLLVK